MWHEARKQEKRIRGMIVDYRKRAERRQDFYEKIQADPTQFIQVHGRRCKIHLDSSLSSSGDGTTDGTIVPWQGQEDNLIDRFDVRAHLDYIPPPTKTETDYELSVEDRQCNYESYRILAQNDFLNVPEEKFLHQLYLEEQFGANAQLEHMSERGGNKKKQPKSAGATIGYSYEDTDSTTQPFSHLMQVPSHITPKSEKDSDSESDSDIDMDVSIDISKLDTSQAHELNSCGRNYGMLSNDFYSYLTKDADEADALRLAREEEQEKMLLSGRKSRRERRAQKERRIASRPFSPPSYAAKEDAAAKKEKDEDSDSRSPSPAEGNSEKITYITSFGGEEELQPHSKISINLPKVSHTLGEACVGASASFKQAQKVKANLERTQKTYESSKIRRRTRSRSRSRSRTHNRSRSRQRSRSKSRGHRHRRTYSKSRTRSRSRSYDKRKDEYSRSYRRQRYQRRRSTSSSSRERRHSPTPSSDSSHYSRRRQQKYKRTAHKDSRSSRSSSPVQNPKPVRIQKITPPVAVEIVKPTPTTSSSGMPIISYPLQTRIVTATSTSTASTTKAQSLTQGKKVIAASTSTLPTVIQVEEPPPPPLKRYYGRKRGEESSSDSNNSDSEIDNVKSGSIDDQNNDTMDMDTTSDRSNPLPSTSGASILGKQTGKYSTAQTKNPSLTNASETKATISTGSIGAPLNLRERLKRKMQNLLNKQYKADKLAEIEKTERERQIQQEREDEMRELALKLRRRQRELRHKYGSPSSSKCSDSEISDIAHQKSHQDKERSKSRSTDRRLAEKRQRTPRRSRSRSKRGRSRRSTSKRRSRSRSMARGRSRRSASKRRRRSPSTGRSRRQRSPSQERYSSRYGSDHSRQPHRQYDQRDRDRNREWDRDRDRVRERDRDRDRNRERVRDRSTRERPREPTSSSTSESNRNRVVISAPPKLKKLVDY